MGHLCHPPTPGLSTIKEEDVERFVRARDQGGSQETELPGQDRTDGLRAAVCTRPSQSSFQGGGGGTQETGTVVGCWEREGFL